MSVRIKYAYLKQQTWLYRRNYPKELQGVLGQAMKQSLKTSDARIAKARVAEVDAKYEEVIAKARAGYVVEKPKPIVVAPAVFSPVVLVGRRTVKDLAHTYLERRSRELQRGGFKSVRFSVGLFVSAYGSRQIGTVTRDDALAFVRKVALLGCHTGKSWRTRGYGLDQLVQVSQGDRISAPTQRRTVGQVGHFLDWAVYEGELVANPFKTVRVEAKGKSRSYAALTDAEVRALIMLDDTRVGDVLRFCLLTGMRSGEAVGLVREDLVWKDNLGWFVWVRPNGVRALKTDAAERFIPLHSSLNPVLERLPRQGRLFPVLTVSVVTKRFAVMRTAPGAGSPRRRVPFHSEVVRDAVRAGGGARTLHGIHRWSSVRAIREQNDLWHLLRRNQRRAEA